MTVMDMTVNHILGSAYRDISISCAYCIGDLGCSFEIFQLFMHV